MRGIILTNMGRNVGRQAANIAMVSSRKDQIAAFTLSHVPSWVLDAVLRVGMRIMEIMQVLWLLVSFFFRRGELENDHRDKEEILTRDPDKTHPQASASVVVVDAGD
jgi:hypothetical protein